MDINPVTHANPIALQFLRRTCGSWRSERRYLFAPKMKPTNMVTEFTVTENEEQGNRFVIDWTGQTEGTMEVVLEGDTLGRSRDYMGSGAHAQHVQVIDQDCIVLTTEYDGIKFREEMRLLESDTIRLRQTVGINKETGQVALVGQYFETRQ